MSGNSWRSTPGSNCAQAYFQHRPSSFIRIDRMSVINWNWIFPPIAWSEYRSILHISNPRRHPVDHQNISRVYLHVVPLTLVKIENRCVCQKFVTFVASTWRWSRMPSCQCDWEGGICICILIVIAIVFVFVLLVVKQHANRSKGRWYLSDCYECRSRWIEFPREFFSMNRIQIEIWTTSPPCQHCQRSFWKQNLWPWNVFEEKYGGDSRSSVLRRTFCKGFPDTSTVDWVFARWKGVRQKDKMLDRSKLSGRVFGGNTFSAKVFFFFLKMGRAPNFWISW